MPKTISPVRTYMSTSTHSIAQTQTLAQAPQGHADASDPPPPRVDWRRARRLALATRSAFDRDAARRRSGGRQGGGGHVQQRVYAIAPDTPLDEVVRTMAEKKLGCAVIMQNTHVVGILTTVDVCRVLANMLHASP